MLLHNMPLPIVSSPKTLDMIFTLGDEAHVQLSLLIMLRMDIHQMPLQVIGLSEPLFLISTILHRAFMWFDMPYSLMAAGGLLVI